MIPRRNRFATKQPSRAYHRAALTMVLMHRADLDTASAESLARSHGLSVAEVTRDIAAERVRRERAA